MHAPAADYLVVWHRESLPGPSRSRPRAGQAELALPVRHLLGRQAAAEVLYPARGHAGVRWDAPRGELTVALPAVPTACLIRLEPA
jgi:hypothetical protein